MTREVAGISRVWGLPHGLGLLRADQWEVGGGWGGDGRKNHFPGQMAAGRVELHHVQIYASVLPFIIYLEACEKKIQTEKEKKNKKEKAFPQSNIAPGTLPEGTRVSLQACA